LRRERRKGFEGREYMQEGVLAKSYEKNYSYKEDKSKHPEIRGRNKVGGKGGRGPENSGGRKKGKEGRDSGVLKLVPPKKRGRRG